MNFVMSSQVHAQVIVISENNAHVSGLPTFAENMLFTLHSTNNLWLVVSILIVLV